MNRFFQLLLSIPALVFSIFIPASSQSIDIRSLTAADYEHAEKFMGYKTSQLIDRSNVTPNWLSNDRFWYHVLTAQGSEFILVDPASGSRTAAFDQQKLAAALSSASGNN